MSPIRLVGWVFESSRGVLGSEQVAQGNWWAWWRFQFYFRELGDILTTSIYDCYYLVNKDLKWLLMKYLWNLSMISQNSHNWNEIHFPNHPFVVSKFRGCNNSEASRPVGINKGVLGDATNTDPLGGCRNWFIFVKGTLLIFITVSIVTVL